MIREFQKEDRDAIDAIIQRIDNFSKEEKIIALELVDDKVLNGNKSHYTIYVYIKDLKLIGYYCIGLRPLTDGVYDIYWIVTDPEFRKEGAGKSLLEHAENFVKERNGRWLLAETSSTDNYVATQKFYLRNKYSIVSEIKDFYKLNDDLMVFGKYITT
ncbi:MAG: GNAT family N-acetyltransferase [Ignavibacteriaceae bacterium]|jgi:aminoglycoside 6'-N-acetyltransferase I|nr:GNAT family N-acetyltransferase [Ignavibacteriaceae bacterium]